MIGLRHLTYVSYRPPAITLSRLGAGREGVTGEHNGSEIPLLFSSFPSGSAAGGG